MIATDHDRLNYLLASNPAIIFACRTDLSPGITYMSENVKWILGYDVDEFYDDPMFWINNVHPDDRIKAKEKYPDLVKLGQWSREYRFLHKDGNYRWMWDEIRVIFDDIGMPKEIVGTWLDVTEKRLAEERLAKQQLIANQFITIANAVFVMLNEDGLIVDINPFTAKTLGYETYDVLGKNWYKTFVAPSIRVEKEWMFHSYLANRQMPDTTIETTVVTATGQERIFVWRKMIVDGEDGERYLICSGNDSTDDIIAQRKLKESEAVYRLIADNSTDILRKTDPDGTINYVSPSVEKVLGYSQDELIGSNQRDLIHPDDLPGLREVYQQYMHGIIDSVVVTARLLKKDGSYIWLETTSKAIKGSNGEVLEFVAISRDISIRKQLESELEEMAQLMKTIHERLPVISYRFNTEGLIQTSFGKGLERLGKVDNEYVGTNAFDGFPELVKNIEAAIKNEYYHFESSGEYNNNPWWFLNYYIKDSLHAGGYIGFSIDITEQKLAQEELFRTKEMYRLLVNSLPKVAVLVFDKDMRFIFAEGQDLEANNFRGENLVGKTLGEIIPGVEKHPLYQPFLDVFQGVSQVFDYEIRGKVFQVHISPLRDKAGNIVSAISISRDITEEKKMEQLLLKVAIESNEFDRKNFSEQLHDGVGQKLSSLKFQLESIDSDVFMPDDLQKQIIERSKNTINDILGQLRLLANDLMPNVLQDFGLDSALEDLCMQTNKSDKVRVNFGSYGMASLSNNYNTDVGIYRIVQELINGAFKRNEKIEILVRLIKTPENLLLTVEKHYINSPVPEFFENTAEFYSISSRTRALNGRLKMDTQDRERLLVSIEVPYN